MANPDAVTNDPSQFRTDPPRIADERDVPRRLDFHRGTLL